MTSLPRPPSASFQVLKVPSVTDLIVIFKNSTPFLELQHDHPVIDTHITRVELWEPFLESVITIVHECKAQNKHSLAAKQKLLTRRLEKVLVDFVESKHNEFNLEMGVFDLPQRVRGVVRLHASNFLRITKQEMCNNITGGGKKVQSIVKNAFSIGIDKIREENDMRNSGQETLYYVTGWLLHAALKAAKQREKEIREQLLVLVENASLAKDIAVGNDNLPTNKVEGVEQFGGLKYANVSFYNFVMRLEYVFNKTLTSELLMMNGACLIDLVYVTLNHDENLLQMMGQFCEDKVGNEVLAAVTKYITRAYCRMRGKDFSRKLMSRDTHSLKQTRRPTLAAVSNPAVHAKRRKKEDTVGDESNNEEIEYLLFDAATGNTATEDKGLVDDINLLEV